ncbi:hypothetical protein [Homoserinibacter sp. YIM 151385]|uniref:hypothetical protein n=1 Tax=Homoserinibacter sp. YIM 151385 TaxID=2985506 RepID=UPI0022F0EB2B|nr:hypothetical protein [Homoserinibacter sp. YIM 151385]WBU37737.1 hypothetical protein OF852_12585 [Homoserinibacter sp. YIM 151385]
MRPPILPPPRWGTVRERALLGLGLLVAGAASIAGAVEWMLWMLYLGSALHAAGWAILPGAGWRRVLAAAVSTPAIWLLISGNPRFLVVLVVPVACWLLVRHRHPLAWLALPIPLAAALAVGETIPGSGGRYPVALALVAASAVAGAWIAALIDARVRSRRSPRPGPSLAP